MAMMNLKIAIIKLRLGDEKVEGGLIESWQQVVRRLKKIVDALNMYHWEPMGTFDMLSDQLPTLPGVYKITDGKREYIGRAIAEGGLRKRIRQHVSSPHTEWESPEDRKRFKVFVHTMDDSADGRVFATIVEAYMILENVSEINIQGKNGSVEINCGEA